MKMPVTGHCLPWSRFRRSCDLLDEATHTLIIGVHELGDLLSRRVLQFMLGVCSFEGVVGVLHQRLDPTLYAAPVQGSAEIRGRANERNLCPGRCKSPVSSFSERQTSTRRAASPTSVRMKKYSWPGLSGRPEPESPEVCGALGRDVQPRRVSGGERTARSLTVIRRGLVLSRPLLPSPRGSPVRPRGCL